MCIYTKSNHVGNTIIINKNIIFLQINLKRNVKYIFDNKQRKKLKILLLTPKKSLALNRHNLLFLTINQK